MPQSMTELGAVPVLLGIDPGKDKCGLAAVGEDGTVRQMMVVPAAEIVSVIQRWVEEAPVLALVVGDRSTGKVLAQRLEVLDVPLYLVPEHESTLRGCRLYFQDHPPQGLMRFVPLSFQVPPRPIDDYAALVIVQDWLRVQNSPEAV